MWRGWPTDGTKGRKDVLTEGRKGHKEVGLNILFSCIKLFSLDFQRMRAIPRECRSGLQGPLTASILCDLRDLLFKPSSRSSVLPSVTAWRWSNVRVRRPQNVARIS